MIPPLDVFSIKNDQPTWLGAAESLVQALEIAKRKGPGTYFVFSHQTGHKSMYTVDVAGFVKPIEPEASSLI
jgi:hypothetical protein